MCSLYCFAKPINSHCNYVEPTVYKGGREGTCGVLSLFPLPRTPTYTLSVSIDSVDKLGEYAKTFGIFRREMISAARFLEGCMDKPNASCGATSTTDRICPGFNLPETGI